MDLEFVVTRCEIAGRIILKEGMLKLERYEEGKLLY